MDIEPTNDLPQDDPRHHALNLANALQELAQHARQDIGKVSDASARVLFETTAEVLLGLALAHEHFAEGAEPPPALAPPH